MTTLQIIVMTCAYAVALVAVIYFTRAPSRRVMGVLAGAAAGGGLGLGAIVLGEALGVWRISLPSTAGVLVLFYLGFAISCSPIYLITWRVARRFGWRGFAVCLIVVGVIGPPRDYLFAAAYPEWMVFARGVAPILADAATYVGIVALGHAVMRFVSGPARGSRLARQPPT
ncbi:MAG: hypothetical protein Q7R30_08000 [Acidobacteriota bacterium]|nr:hypothetical protein [Acidobacteriota bacterium]